MIDRNKSLSVRAQCALLAVNRASYYYKPVEKGDSALANAIAELYQQHPVYGYRRIHALLSKEFCVNRKRVARLMREMNLKAIYPGPKTTQRNREHKIFPNRLKRSEIVRAYQCYQVDITYLRTTHGFLYLVALMDSYSRYVVSWRIANTLEATPCVDALLDALAFNSCPEMVHSDQGVQFTSQDWIGVLESKKITISMSGQGRSIDNAEIERLWRSLKYEWLYIEGCRSVEEVKSGVSQFIKWYNLKRPHQALDYKTPAELLETEGLAPLSQEAEETTNQGSQYSLILA